MPYYKPPVVSGVVGSGTDGFFAKYLGGGVIGSSLLSEAGSVITNSGDLRFSGTGSPGLRLKSLTTTQRDATSGGNGDLIYNATTDRVNLFRAGSWGNGWVRLEGDSMTGPLVIAGGTVTANAPVLDMSQTWNNGSGTFYGLDLSITDTASASTSRPVRVRLGGSSIFELFKSGTISLPGGALIVGGGNIAFNNSSDTVLIRDGAGLLGLRNGANPLTFSVYGTYTDSGNYRRLRQTMTTGGAVTISAEGLGTGATGNTLEFNVDGTASLRVLSGGAYVQSAQQFGWLSRSRLLSPSDGVIGIYNSSGTDFTRLQFGGTTSSFPALKRSTTTIQAVLADDSGFAATQDLYNRFGSGTPEANVTAPIGAIYHRTDGGAGTSLYVKESGAGNTGWVAK